MNIAIISASVREGRQSHRVALYLAHVLSADPAIQSQLIDLAAHEIPPLDYTMSKHPNPPADLQQIGQWLDEADAILFVSPEYNGSYTDSLKRVIDYFPKSAYQKKPIGVVSVSSGGNGGIRGALQMQELVLAIWALPIPQMLLVPRVAQQLDEDGHVLNEAFDVKAKSFLGELRWLAEAVEWKKAQVPALS